MLADPVGNATPNTAERSTFPWAGLICHFSAGATSETPEFLGPRTFAKYVGVSTRNSRQFAIPVRKRVFVPSTNRSRSRVLKLTPFSICRLPAGTTRLEFVTSGRSVVISSLVLGQPSALAVIVPRQTAKPSTTIASLQTNARAVRTIVQFDFLLRIRSPEASRKSRDGNHQPPCTRERSAQLTAPSNHHCTKSRGLG